MILLKIYLFVYHFQKLKIAIKYSTIMLLIILLLIVKNVKKDFTLKMVFANQELKRILIVKNIN